MNPPSHLAYLPVSKQSKMNRDDSLGLVGYRR